jgi:hypothetical protein
MLNYVDIIIFSKLGILSGHKRQKNACPRAWLLMDGWGFSVMDPYP